MKNPWKEVKRLEEEVSNLHQANTRVMEERNSLRQLTQSYLWQFESDRADLREMRDLLSQVLDRPEPSL